jgi:putative two-component system response regulator
MEEKAFTLNNTILFLEDSEPQAQSLKEVLMKRGLAVTHAKDGLAGLYALMELRPRLIISDVWMPKMDGYKFCATVKADINLQDIPIILLTSLSSMKDIVNGLNAGADYYLTKPYSENLLVSMVESILSDDKPTHENEKRRFVVKMDNTRTTINTSPNQILNFLFSTYENFLSQNEKLLHTKHELKKLNDSLEERVREKTRSLEKTVNGIVAALATAVEMRDPYTAGHQLRVSQIACAIAKERGLSEEEVEGIRVMAFLHDIGKIIVPAEILSKPSRLADYEFNFIKAHSRAGYDILKGIDFPWPVSEAVLQHHERINGSGYPSGLTGGQIIIEAKIIAAADVIESMASHRPYRPAIGISAALEEIEKNKGILYDTEVADICLKLFRENGFRIE